MNRIECYIAIGIIVVLSSATGCKKDDAARFDASILSFTVQSQPYTKGTLVNTDGTDQLLAGKGITEFKAAAFKGSTPVFDKAGSPYVETVTYSAPNWNMDHVYYWPESTSMTFYAYANTTGVTIATDGSGMTLSHTVSSTVTAQKDVLLGYYRGNGGNTGTAEISFGHPLTAITFKRGDLNMTGDVVNIKRITLNGIAPSGSIQMDATGTLSTWSVPDYSGTAVLGNGSADLPYDGTTGAIGSANDVFLIIPQNASVHNIGVEVLATTLDGSKTYTASVTSVNLEAGKTYEFTIYPHATRWLGITYKSPWSSETTF